jgi:hypothetical protein
VAITRRIVSHLALSQRRAAVRSGTIFGPLSAEWSHTDHSTDSDAW